MTQSSLVREPFAIRISSKKFIQFLLWITGLLSMIHVTGLCLTRFGGRLFNRGFFGLMIGFFNFDTERNVPTLFSTGLLLLSGLLFLLLWKVESKGRVFKLNWAVLGAVFIFLGIDEYAGIHEYLTGFMQRHFQVSGFLYFGWVIPYGIAALVLGLAFLRTWLRLHPLIKRWFLLAAVTYLMGALGCEMIAAKIVETNQLSLGYDLISTLEELLEMLGVIILIHALLRLLHQYLQDWSIIISDHKTL